MRHLKYEWEKFLSFRYFWFLCAVFLLFNLWNLSEQIRMEFPAASVRQLYTDFQEQPEGAKGQWLEEQKATLDRLEEKLDRLLGEAKSSKPEAGEHSGQDEFSRGNE